MNSDPHIPAKDVCRFCGADARLLGVQRVLRRYDVGYYRCPGCDLIQTQWPFWLDEAYGTALSAFDTGAVARTRSCRDLVLSLAWLLGVGPDDPCLDYGGGHGILTRALRDDGYNFHWHDPYASNLLARGFEGQPDSRYSLLTCFEVLEHLPDVSEGLEALFAPGHDHLLVSTVLHLGHRENWWYYCPEAGQHVAFFSQRTMRLVAERYGYNAIVTPRYTLFSKTGRLRGWRRSLATKILNTAREGRLSLWGRLALGLRPRNPSRVWDDHVELMRREEQARGSAIRQEEKRAA